MPVNYPGVAPWLHPPDIAGSYSKGFGLGLQSGEAQARIAMEQARLAQHANQQAVEITLKQQQLERQNMVEQQKLEVAKAYHQEQTQLKAQELEMKQQAMEEKIKQEATRQMAIERFKNAIAGGEDPSRALLLNVAGQTGMGGPTSTAIRTLSEIAKARADSNVQPLTKKIGNVTLAWMPGGKTLHEIKEDGGLKPLTPSTALSLAKHEGLSDDQRDFFEQYAIEQGKKMTGGFQATPKPEEKSIWSKIGDFFSGSPPTTEKAPEPSTAGATMAFDIYTDKTGRNWRYLGTADEPLDDKDKSSWELVQ